MKWEQFFSIVELRTKVISLSTVAIALCFTVYSGFDIDPLRLTLLIPAVLFVDMGTTAFNTLFDFLKGTDAADTNKEADKVLVHRNVSPNAALWAGLGCYAAAAVCGALLSMLTGWQIAAAGAVSMVIGAAYTAGPFPISRGPLGELFAGGFLGTVLFCIVFFVFAGTVTLRAVLVSLPSFFVIASVLTANNTCDTEGDRKNGRKTLSILLGPARAKAFVYGLGIMGFLVLAAYYYYGVVPATVRFPLGFCLFGVFWVYRKMHALGFSHKTKSSIMQLETVIVMLLTLAVTGGYLWYFAIT